MIDATLTACPRCGIGTFYPPRGSYRACHCIECGVNWIVCPFHRKRVTGLPPTSIKCVCPPNYQTTHDHKRHPGEHPPN